MSAVAGNQWEALAIRSLFFFSRGSRDVLLKALKKALESSREAKSFEDQGIVNALWALAKLCYPLEMGALHLEDRLQRLRRSFSSVVLQRETFKLNTFYKTLIK